MNHCGPLQITFNRILTYQEKISSKTRTEKKIDIEDS